MVKFDGDHNDLRPGFFLDSCCIFLKQVLLIPDSRSLDVPTDGEGRPLSLGQALRAQARQAQAGGALTRIPTGMMPAEILSMLGGPVSRHTGDGGRGGGGAAAAGGGGGMAIDEVEEELLRQAIAASLEAAGAAGGAE